MSRKIVRLSLVVLCLVLSALAIGSRAEAAIAWAEGRLQRRLVCLIGPANAPSLRLAARLGFAEYARTTYRGEPTVLLERL